MNSTKEKLGYIIKVNRKLNKLSQKKLAQKINYNQSIVSKVEQGNKELPLSLYVRLLKVLELDYQESESTNKQIEELIEDIYSAIVRLKKIDADYFLSIINEIHIKNRDAIRYYDLLCIELILLFYKELYSDCGTYLEYLINFYHLCHPKCQFLLFYLNHYLAHFENVGTKFTIPEDVIGSGKENGISHYLLGWTNLNELSYSKSITEFYYAIKQFKKTNNLCRIILCEIYINQILLMDKNYQDVIERTEEFIEQFRVCSNVVYSVEKLYFQLSYSYFQIGEIHKAQKAITKINHDDGLIAYLRLRIDEKLELDLIDFSKIKESKHTILICLYFKYQDKKNESYYHLIEKYIIPYFKDKVYVKEYQDYAWELLSYYWAKKKYKKYKELNDKLHSILHIH